MNKSLKLTICLLLVLCLSVSAFAGCKKVDKPNTSSTPDASQTDDQTEDNTEQTDDETIDDEFVDDQFNDDWSDDVWDDTSSDNWADDGFDDDWSEDSWEDDWEEWDDSAPKELYVDNSTYLNQNFLGVNFIHQLYNRMPDKLERNYDDAMIELEKETMQKMRVKMIRSFYGSSLSWDNAKGKHDFESEYMKAFYQSCLDMQEIGVEVGITPQWQITNLIDGKKPDETQGVSIQSMGYLAYDEAGKVDLDKTYENFADFVKESVLAFKSHGVNNVKQMFCFTECNNTMNNYTKSYKNINERRDYETLYPIFDGMISAVDKGLKDAGLREDYQIIAPCDNWRADDGSETYSYLVKYTVENLLDKVDIIGSHNGYARADDYSTDGFYDIPVSKLSDTMRQAQQAGKEYWIDEYNVAINATTALATKEANLNPFRATAFASMVNSVMNMGGVSNFYIWTLFDQQWPNSTSSTGEFLSGVHVCGTFPCLIESRTPTPSWYSQSLITRYIGQGKTFLGSSDASIYCSAIERDDGELTILVTNYNIGDTAFNLTFTKSIGGKTLYRYLYNPNTIEVAPGNAMIAADAKEDNVTTGFSDIIPSMSVAVYTTEKP